MPAPCYKREQFSAAGVDPLTLAYLERVSRLQGQMAVDAWVSFTGYDDNGHRITPGARMENARRNAVRDALPRAPPKRARLPSNR